MHGLNFEGREQLYYQLYNALFQDIINGKYNVGSLFPAESKLVKMYHVSRATVRRAVDMLAADGFIAKKQGYGTTVISNQPKGSPKRVVKYCKKQELNQMPAIKKVIDHSIIPAPKGIAKFLNLSPGQELMMLKRVRYADKEPLYCEINYFEYAYIPHAIHRDFSQESLRVFLNNTCNIQWSYAHQEIYSTLAEEEIAKLLHIKPGSPLIYLKRISFDKQLKPREYVATYYRGDKYHLEIELTI